ncbi:MAG: response regulator [Magnetococcales bacterium]|nr:response regulator [Magnetococcales bacterium]
MAHILLIDDDQGVRYLLRSYLEMDGHHIMEAENGQDGIKIGCSGHFDLVFTDMIMPEKDGIEVIMELLESHPQLKIIAISGGGRGLDAQFNLQIAEDFGALGTIAKPFDRETVMTMVNQLLYAS